MSLRALSKSCLGCVAVVALLAACVSPASTGSNDFSETGLSASRQPVLPLNSNGNIYVGNAGPKTQSIVVYNVKNDGLIHTIRGGLSLPAPFVSPAGQLYVANTNGNTVNVYDNTYKLVRSLTRGIVKPSQVAFDSNDDVYVRTSSKVLVFPDGKQDSMQSIKVNSSYIAVDAHDNLYVAGPGGVEIFKPHAKKPFHTIGDDSNVSAIAFDSKGNLYIANFVLGGCGPIGVYSRTTYALQYSITQGLCDPARLAIGSDGNLYVLNYNDRFYPNGSVQVYPLGQSRLSLTITDGLYDPLDIVLDQNANLYVSNNTRNVTVYASGSSNVLRKISKGLNWPFDLAFGH
jgi:hypothetical protein